MQGGNVVTMGEGVRRTLEELKPYQPLGIEIIALKIRQAADIAPALEALKGRAEALYVVGEALTSAYQLRINSFALAALTVGSSCLVAFSRNIVYSTFALLGAFMGVVGLYVLLAADFVAMVQLLVYVGGILVLTIFAVLFFALFTSLIIGASSTIGMFGPALLGALVAITLPVLIGFVFTIWLANRPRAPLPPSPP